MRESKYTFSVFIVYLFCSNLFYHFIFADENHLAGTRNGNRYISNEKVQESEFICIQDSTNKWKPKRVWQNGKKSEVFPALGRGGVSQIDCEKAISSARNGIVCSYTLIGWKPTHYSGYTAMRASLGKENYGFYGSSIEGAKALDLCTKATLHSTETGVCFWNGGDWMIGKTSREAGSVAGISGRTSFRNLDECLNDLTPGWQNVQYEKKSAFQLVSYPKEVFETTHDKGIRGQYCMKCHGESLKALPEWAMDAEKLKSHIEDPTNSKAAHEWLQKLHDHLVSNPDMPPKGEGREHFETDPKATKFTTSIKEMYKKYAKPEHQIFSSDTKERSKASKILADDWHKFYRDILPETKDTHLQSALSDPVCIYFNEHVLPAAYQDTSTSVIGVRTSDHGTFVAGAPFRDPRTNKLRLFGHGVGIDPHSSSQVFHSLCLPKDKDGTLEKIKMWIEKPRETVEDGAKWYWAFPVNTVSAEVVYAKNSEGTHRVQEIRTRKKNGVNKSQWMDNIFRAFVTEKDLVAALDEIHNSKSNLFEEAAEVKSKLIATPLTPVKMDNGGYQLLRLQISGYTQVLPEMSEALVMQLLKRPFQSSLGTVWKKEGDKVAFSPTTSQAFGLVPQQTTAGALAVNSNSCNRCHDLGNTPIYDLYTNHSGAFGTLLDRTTRQYGNTPGNDGNLRWHPFNPGLLPQFSQVNDNRQTRPEFKEIIEWVKK